MILRHSARSQHAIIIDRHASQRLISLEDIREHLIKELGIEHRENYISTIWNKAVKSIAEAVELNYDEYLCKDY